MFFFSLVHEEHNFCNILFMKPTFRVHLIQDWSLISYVNEFL